MNEVELRWYNTLSQQRTPEGYRHCTDCDSQRPARFFNGKGRKCVDCIPVGCSECPNKAPRRDLSKEGSCGECTEPSKHKTRGKANRVVDGKKVCGGECGMLLDASEDFYQNGNSPKSECKRCYNQKRKKRADGRRSRRARYGVSERSVAGLRRSLENIIVPVTPVMSGASTRDCSLVDWTLSKRERYMLFAPSEEYDPVQVFYRDNWECQLCGDPIPMDTDDYRLRATVDHIVPVVSSDFWMHGDTLPNVQAAHGRCNSMKGNRL